MGINSKQLDAGIESKIVPSSCGGLAESDVRQYFAAFKCCFILLVSQRESAEAQRLLQPQVQTFPFKKTPREIMLPLQKVDPFPLESVCFLLLSSLSRLDFIHVLPYLSFFHSLLVT